MQRATQLSPQKIFACGGLSSSSPLFRVPYFISSLLATLDGVKVHVLGSKLAKVFFIYKTPDLLD
jgi:hypothetical protein